MLKNFIHNLIKARQSRADIEIAKILQRLEYRHEQSSYLEHKINSK
jgi:hypothetical protein